MKTYKKCLYVGVCAVSLVIGGLAVASLSAEGNKAQLTTKSMTKGKTMFFFSAAANKATIRSIDSKTDQISFHDVQSITFVSHYPKVIAGDMNMEKFVKEVWNDNSKVNIAVAGIGSYGSKKIHAFEAFNPRYDAATKDFTIDVIAFGSKTIPGFKAQKETELRNVTLWISGLAMEKRAVKTLAFGLAEESSSAALGTDVSVVTAANTAAEPPIEQAIETLELEEGLPAAASTGGEVGSHFGT